MKQIPLSHDVIIMIESAINDHIEHIVIFENIVIILSIGAREKFF